MNKFEALKEKVDDLDSDLTQSGAFEQEVHGKTELLSSITATLNKLDPIKREVDRLAEVESNVLSAGEVIHFNKKDHASGYTEADMIKLAETILATIKEKTSRTSEIFADSNIYREGIKQLRETVEKTCDGIEMMVLNAFMDEHQ